MLLTLAPDFHLEPLVVALHWFADFLLSIMYFKFC